MDTNNVLQLRERLLQDKQFCMQFIQMLEDENNFWDLVTCAIGFFSIYYVNYLYKEPCHTSYWTGERLMNDLLFGGEKRCFRTFRMNQDIFRQLCMDLENKYGLRASDRMSIVEKVGIFLFILGKGASNRDAQERFQHSGEIVSEVFEEVLDVMDGLSRDILKPRDPEFKEIPSYIANNSRYMPHFKDCIGAIDGTHINVIIHEEMQMRCKERKGTPTMNVFVACDFDLLFTYVLTAWNWKGTTHDARIFLETINDPSLNFPKPPKGKYYLADKDYPEREGFLTPYSKIRYNQFDFQGIGPRGYCEIFNHVHSSLRSCTERAFGVLKARWKILKEMRIYSLKDQNRIVRATFALHNYIRLSKMDDPAFKLLDKDPDFVPPNIRFERRDCETNYRQEENDGGSIYKQVSSVRDNIAYSLVAARPNKRHRRF